MLGPNGAIVGQFTTNPGYVWSQHLASYYGGDAAPAWSGNNTATPTPRSGDNWAVGGARVGTSAVGGLGYTPSMTAQYQAYLAAGNTVDPGALYTVWGGANDLFAVQANPAQASAIIGGAVTAQIGMIGALTQAGAQYILVPNLPDLGLTPDARAGGAHRNAGGEGQRRPHFFAVVEVKVQVCCGEDDLFGMGRFGPGEIQFLALGFRPVVFQFFFQLFRHLLA